jgi:hypothetical protein
MSKKMSDAAYVERAAEWSRHLVNREIGKGANTLDEAMDRASQRYGIDRHTFWAMRYRRPKDILASIYFRMKSAYEAECTRQEKALRHELDMAMGLPGSRLITLLFARLRLCWAKRRHRADPNPQPRDDSTEAN